MKQPYLVIYADVPDTTKSFLRLRKLLKGDLMPKYGRYQVETEAKEKKDALHPIWRGIGCVLLIVIPIISGFFSNYLVNQRNTFSWMIIPNELIINRFEDPMIAVKAVYFIIIALLLFLIMGIITFLMDKIFSGSKSYLYKRK